MPEARPTPRAPTADDSASQVMRQLGQRAHQLRATTRAAEHFSAQGSEADRNTGSWLMSCAVAMAGDLAGEVDALSRMIKEQPADVMFKQTVSLLRVRAHQVHAATRAADHFLDGDSAEDQDTGSWLVSTAYTLAKQLAAEVDDSTTPLRRPALDKTSIEPHDPVQARRMARATAVPQASSAP
jgi:predicted Zn-dependent protease